jgi:hypothetical protein
VWKWNTDKKCLSIAYESITHDDYPVGAGKVKDAVRGTFASLWLYELQPDLHGVPQTKVQCTARVNLGGTTPTGAIKTFAFESLMSLSRMRLRFDRSAVIVRESIGRFVREVECETETVGDDKAVQQGEALMAEIGFEAKTVESSGDSGIHYETGRSATEKAVLYGTSHADVRGSCEDVLGWLWLFDSRNRLSDNDFERSVEKTVSPKKQVVKNVLRGNLNGSMLDTGRKVICTEMSWSRLDDDDSYMIVGVPYAAGGDGRRRSSAAAGRRSSISVAGIQMLTGGSRESKIALQYVIIVKKSHAINGHTRVQMFLKLDMRTTSKLLKKVHHDYLIYFLNSITFSVHAYFLQQRTLINYDEEDGRAIGHACMRRTRTEEFLLRDMRRRFGHHKKRGHHVLTDRVQVGGTRQDDSYAVVRFNEIVRTYVGMGEFTGVYPWFTTLMSTVITARLAIPHEVPAMLSNLSHYEAYVMGSALPASLAAALTSQSAVDEWILRYPSLRELDAKCAWFRPMMIACASEILGKVSWGVKFRVCFGAGLSFTDMVSDFFIIYNYINGENTEHFGFALLAMVLLSLTCQLIIVWVQNPMKNVKMMLVEMIMVLVGLKPGLDAYKVATDRDQLVYNTFDPKFELILNKFVEMFAESLPGCMLQSYVFIDQVFQSSAKDWFDGDAKIKLASILISAATAGYTSASITYDNDVDPVKRRTNMGFYGFIPDDASSRAILFTCMIINSCAYLLIRAFAFGLGSVVDYKAVAIYHIVDISLFYLTKLGRGDMFHYVPISGVGAYPFSAFIRFIMKFVADFTAVIHLRHPGELGGLYWSFNVVMGLVASWFMAIAYFVPVFNSSMSIVTDGELVYSDGLQTKVSFSSRRDYAFWFLGLLTVVWFMASVAILVTMAPSCRSSFTSTETGYSMITKLFVLGETDEIRAQVFFYNRRLWSGIKHDVRDFIRDHYKYWEDDKPEWFTPVFKASVPKSFQLSNHLYLRTSEGHDKSRRVASIRDRSIKIAAA